MAPNSEKRLPVKQLNSHLICSLCQGYFIDATTITECLHTFCRSCIVMHFKTSILCPICEIKVDRLFPTEKLTPDPRKQLLVYKIVPRLHQNEMARQEMFQKNHGEEEKRRPILPKHLPDHIARDRIVDGIYIYGPEQKISLSLEYECGTSSAMHKGMCLEKQVNSMKRFLQCPAAITMYHLKKFIRLKYEIGPTHEISIFYEGESLPDSCSLMDVAYQFFWEAKSPMRFTYRIVLRNMVRPREHANHQQEPLTTRAPSPPPPLSKPTRPVGRNSIASSTRHVVRTTAATSSNSQGAKKSMHRRQLRQRSAKTAAYKSLEAMDEEVTSDKEEAPPIKRRKSHKSPRWDSDDSSFDSFTVYRSTRSGKTPKPSLNDTEARYHPRPGTKTVYSAAVSSSMTDDSASSDAELSEPRSESRSGLVSSTKSNELKLSSVGHMGRKSNSSKQRNSIHRRRPAATDVYEFHSNNEDTNEDSNTTLEYEFVYDDNKESESDSQENCTPLNADEKSTNGITGRLHGTNDTHQNMSMSKEQLKKEQSHEHEGALRDQETSQHVDVEERELEQHIEMEVMTEQDLEQHIEDSIEEVEIDVDGEEEHSNNDPRNSQEDLDTMDTETASSCLVIAEEEEEDDGVVEEVIAAEEDGHELVVLENPDNIGTSYVDADTTGPIEVRLKSTPKIQKQSSPVSSRASEGSPTVEEDEPEILHERVSRKKSKKTKHHHHHHHHHKHRHRHSPVLLVSSAEEAPMKLTLKLRPTPSISPTNSSLTKTQNDGVSKTRKYTFSVQSPKGETMDAKGTFSPKHYSCKSFKLANCDSVSPTKRSPERPESPDIKSPTPEPLSPPAASPEEFSPKSPTPEPLSPRPPSPLQDSGKQEPLGMSVDSDSHQQSRRPTLSTSLKEGTNKMTQSLDDKNDVDESNNRAARLRVVRVNGSNSSNCSSSDPDLKRVKTPSSLIISKVEAGELPPRLQHETNKPALEILMLPPSPPPCVDDHGGNTSCSEETSMKRQDSSLPAMNAPIASKTTHNSVVRESKHIGDAQSAGQSGALDLSGKTRRPDPSAFASGKSSPRNVSESQSRKVSVITSSIPVESDPVASKNDRNVAQPHDLGLVPKASLVAYRNLMNMGVPNSEHLTAKLISGLTASNSQGLKHPLITPIGSQSVGSLSANQRGRPVPALNDLFPNRRIGAFNITSSTPRPNQFMRHIPNPSALFQRQHQQHQQQQIQETMKKQQGQLTEAQLKERYQLFQQNQAARGVHTYSRISNNVVTNQKPIANTNRVANSSASRPIVGAIGGPQFLSGNHINNNNILMKNAARSRSIEKVAAGLLSVRTNNFPLEAQAGR